MPNKKKSISVDMNEANDNLSNSDEEDAGNFVCPELDSVFKTPFYLESEEAITLKKNYILHMSAASTGSETRLGLGMSSYEACVYSVGESLKCTLTLPAMSSPVINIRFAPENPSLMYTGCSKGEIKLWDLRNVNKPAQQFKDTSDPKSKNLHEKNFCSFDVSSSGRFLCAGTEVTDGDAFLLFWDTRQASLLGGYWDCHTDDVTQVCFHPSDGNQLVTGSTDGLINLYNISESDESEALLQSFNTESSVDKLQWHVADTTTVSCITHTADVQLWHLDDSSPYNTFNRPSIATALQMGNEQLEDSLYVADVHSTAQPDHLMILAGSNFGNGRCLRSAVVSSGKLNPQSYFDSNKQIVRCSWLHPQNQFLVTGGEAGILSLWKSGTGVPSPVSQLKAASKFKEKPNKKKSKPY